MDQKQAAAEQVRAHLVMVRGGAPFLSSVDSKLLVDWLDEAIPVDVILTAIEEVASRRSKARIKRPLSLNAVKSVVKKTRKKEALTHDTGAFARLIQRLKGSELPELESVAAELALLSARGLSSQQLLPEVLEVARRFHERTWDQCNKEALLSEARLELGDLEAMLSASRFKNAMEEVARDNLRKRYKLLSATHLSQVFRS